MDEIKYIQKLQWVVLISSALVILALAGSVVREGVIKSWRDYQEEFIFISERIADSVGIPASFEKGIYQLELDHFRRMDRCISCHSGLESAVMHHAPQPHTRHPGKLLEDHPPEKFGCTFCHGGQGRALTKDEAFGLDPAFHWPQPLLSYPYIQASCGKCHLSVYNTKAFIEGTEVFMTGRDIFAREGCLGCHKVRGAGGLIGPDLTEQGEKTKHEYSFRNISGEQTVSNWLKEHFKDPEMVSPGSQMLKIDLPGVELDALATFVMGLARPDIPLDFFSIETLNELKGKREMLDGSKVYSFTCSACHGKEGEGKDYAIYEMGVPAIMNLDFLRVASEDFIRFTMMKGRSMRQMGSWEPGISGWHAEELDELISYLKDHGSGVSSAETPVSLQGDKGRGRNLFNKNCMTCHGEDGSGGMAIGLNKKDFLQKADRYFIIKTITTGRKNSGMPGWPVFDKKDLSDIIAYFNSWYRIPDIDRTFLLPEGDLKEGEIRYHYLCSRCHGDFGEGETGPAILDHDFLKAAPDRYLFETISGGRSHTAMFGWSTEVVNEERLGKRDITDLIAFMRSRQSERPDYIRSGSNPGDMGIGKALFGHYCAECHGKEGEGFKAPALNNQEFLSAASNGYIKATITIGRDHTGMPSWGYPGEAYPELSGKDRQDISAFIRSWQRIRIKF